MIRPAPESEAFGGRPTARPIDMGARARRMLRESPYPTLRKIDCRYRAGVLVLTGEVPTYYMKQLAQTVVKRLEHVRQIDNQIVVLN